MDESTQEIKIETRKVVKISKKKFKWVIIVLVIVVLGYLALSSLNSARYKGGTFGANIETAMPSIQSDNYGGMNDRYYNNQEPTISDTREFLKTSYSADIKTRDVKGVITDIKNMVKGADGRVDNFRSSEKSGYVSFVVAKSKFEAFRTEVEAITHKKLYTETISSENLLSQKQDIEQQGNNIVSNLNTYNDQRDALNVSHKKTLASINNELSSIKGELATIRANITSSIDQQIIISLRNQESSLIKRDTELRKKLTAENNNFAVQDKNLLNLINNENGNLTANNKQDNQLLDNVETVNGVVYVEWVSLWELATIFSPISPVIIIIILVIILWIVLKKKGKIPKVVLE